MTDDEKKLLKEFVKTLETLCYQSRIHSKILTRLAQISGNTLKKLFQHLGHLMIMMFQMMTRTTTLLTSLEKRNFA